MESETTSDSGGNTPPIVCTLTTKAAAAQASQWVDLHHRAIEVRAIDGGARFTLPASMVDDVEGLAQRERSCCAFLDIQTTVHGEVLTLEITSADPEALPVIAAMAGISRI